MGRGAAEHYVDGIHEAISDDRARRIRSRNLDFVVNGLRKMRQGRHFIYYREIDDGLLVIRVLHDMMDETQNLIGHLP